MQCLVLCEAIYVSALIYDVKGGRTTFAFCPLPHALFLSAYYDLGIMVFSTGRCFYGMYCSMHLNVGFHGLGPPLRMTRKDSRYKYEGR